MRKEIRRILFRLERILLIILFLICIKFAPTQPGFWIGVFMLSLLMNKFEDSIRSEYDDTTKNMLRKLLEEEINNER